MKVVISRFFRTVGAELEDRGFVRVVDMGFDLVARFRAQIAHQGIENAEHVQVVAFLRHGVLEGLAERLAGILHDLHGIGHDEAAETGAGNDHKFKGLKECIDMAAHGHEAAYDAADGHH